MNKDIEKRPPKRSFFYYYTVRNISYLVTEFQIA